MGIVRGKKAGEQRCNATWTGLSGIDRTQFPTPTQLVQEATRGCGGEIPPNMLKERVVGEGDTAAGRFEGEEGEVASEREVVGGIRKGW